MHTLLPFIQEWFISKKEHFTTFADADTRLEGWFKAELLVLMNRLAKQGHLDSFEREANVTSVKDGSRKLIDFRLRLQGQEHLCELKALCISQAAGTPRNLQFYFRDDHVGLIKDFKKLDELVAPNRWVLGFIYPSPDLNEWSRTISALPSLVQHWQPITKPCDFPAWAFISLWKR